MLKQIARQFSLPAAPPPHPRYESLDAWRGFACLVVIVFHSVMLADVGADGRRVELEGFAKMVIGFLRCLWLGVPCFFVISGFCIAASADSAARQSGGMSKFFLRRLRRIFPPYWILWASSAIVFACFPRLLRGGEALVPAAASLSPWQLVGNLTLTEMWRPNLIGGPGRLHLEHAWTLCYEEQFYLVTGLVLLALGRRLFLGLLAVTVAVLCVAPLSFKHVAGVRVIGFFFDGSWLLFAAGSAVYFGMNYAAPTLRRWMGLLFLAAFTSSLLVLIWAPRRLVLGPAETLLLWQFVYGSAFASVLHWASGYDHRTAASCVGRFLKPFGTRCYSLYLVHYPVVVVTNLAIHHCGLTGPWWTIVVAIPVGMLASIAMAWPFHVAVERRFMSAPSERRTGGAIDRRGGVACAAAGSKDIT